MQIFAKADIPPGQTAFAIEILNRFHLILELPNHGDQLFLSIWGRYFLSRVAFDLPYISTIWWTTPILEDFIFEHPHEPRVPELRQYAGRFLSWLRFEDQIARRHLSPDSTGFLSVFDEASERITWSLHRIEMAKTVRRR